MRRSGKEINNGTISRSKIDSSFEADLRALSGSTGGSGTSGTSGTSGASGLSGSTGTSGTSGTSGSDGSVPSYKDKNIPALVTTSDGDPASATGIEGTPVGYVSLKVNGTERTCGDGDKTKDYYWSTNGGATALPYNEVVNGAKPYWNGSIAEFQLGITDTLTFEYNEGIVASTDISGSKILDGTISRTKIDAEFESDIASMEVVGGLTQSPSVTVDLLNKSMLTIPMSGNLGVTSVVNIADGGSLIRYIHSGATLTFLGMGGFVNKDGEYHVQVINYGSNTLRVFDMVGGASVTLPTQTELATGFNTTLITAEKISYLNLKDVPVISNAQIVYDVILNSRIPTLFSNPYTLKAAPGIDIVDDVTETWVYLEYNTNPYTINTTLNLRSGNVTIGTCDCLGGTVGGWYKFTLNGNEPETNAALTISVASGETSNGNSHIGVISGYVQRSKSVFTFPSFSSVPGEPTSLVAGINGSDVSLDWITPASDGGSVITGYKIDRNKNNGGWTTLVANTGNVNIDYTDTNPGTGTYTYRVSAINAIGTGGVSNTSDAVVFTNAIPRTMLINFGNIITNPQNILGTNYYYNNGGDTSATVNDALVSPIDSSGNTISVNFDIITRSQGNDLSSSITVTTDNILNPVVGTDSTRMWTGGYATFGIRITGLEPSSSYVTKAVGRRSTYDSTVTMEINGLFDSWIMNDGNTEFAEITSDSDTNGDLIIEFSVTAGATSSSAYVCGVRIMGLMQ